MNVGDFLELKGSLASHGKIDPTAEIEKMIKGCEGFTFYFVVGRYGKFGIRIDGPSLRITLGWIALSFILYDIERATGKIIKYVGKLEAELKSIKESSST